MRGALERLGERGDQSGVLIGDHQLHPGEPTGAERAQEAPPERLSFGVADVAAQDLSVAVGGDPGCHDDGHRGDLRGLVADVQICRIEIDVGELDVVELAGPERAHHLVESRTDARHFRLGDPRVDSQRGDQIIDGPCGHTGDVGLHHHRVEGLIDPATRLQDAREERAAAELRNLELDIAGLGGQQTRSSAVAVSGAALGTFVAFGADHFGGFGLDQLLQYEPDGLADQIHAVTGAECVQQIGHGRL